MIKKKIYEEIMKLINETCGLDNLLIIHDKKMDLYGSTLIDEDCKLVKANLKETKTNIRKEFDIYEMTIMYDGGLMYSIMSCEFGYTSKDIFIGKLEVILKKYKLGYEEYDNVTMVIYKE